MLSIKSITGVDLVANPPEEQKDFVQGATNVAITVVLNAIEDDTTLASQKISGTLDWNDGSQPTVYNGNGTLAVDASKGLGAGTHIIHFQAQNFRAPAPDILSVNIPVVVERQDATTASRRLIYGPILPRDAGAPNASTWSLDTKSDLLVLESSVKMLLITAKGERICEPEYGTRLRRILFDQNVNGIEAQVSEEIVSALASWEPRVQLVNLIVNKTEDGKGVVVNVTVLSKLSQQTFDVNLEFVR